MYNVKIIQKVTSVSQTYIVRRNSSEMVRLDWPFHRHSTQLGHDKCQRGESFENACDPETQRI